MKEAICLYISQQHVPQNPPIIVNIHHIMNSPSTNGLLDLVDSSQHLKDLKLAIEFKYLMKHAPGGVYLLPEFEDIRRLHGVIFVRRGLYRNGIFRFVMTLPKMYNSLNTHPEIIFNPPIFNPLINPEVYTALSSYVILYISITNCIMISQERQVGFDVRSWYAGMATRKSFYW